MAYRSKADRPGTPAYRKKMAEKRAAEKAKEDRGSSFKGIAHIRDTHTPEGRPIKPRGTKPGTTKPRGVRAKPATQAEMDKQQRAKGPGRGSAPGSPGAKLDKAYRAVTGKSTKTETTRVPGSSFKGKQKLGFEAARGSSAAKTTPKAVTPKKKPVEKKSPVKAAPKVAPKVATKPKRKSYGQVAKWKRQREARRRLR